MKPLTTLLTATLLSAASLTACSGTENGMSIQQQTEQRFKLNPNPKQAYRIKIKINDAPGPLKLVSDMAIGYLAKNCSYVINEIAGARAKPEKELHTKIRQTGQDEYETVVYLDAMQDEDYFGQGVCRWQASGFGVAFQATGRPEETRFTFGDFIDELLEKKMLTKYYQRRGYPYYKNYDGSPIEDNTFPDSGENSINNYGSELQHDLFSITFTIEEL